MKEIINRRAFCRAAAGAAMGVCAAPARALARGINPQRPAATGVFLTIDDGPRRSTEILLDILRPEDRAAFFLIGEQVRGTGEHAACAALDRGHDLGNHSQTHPHFSNITFDAARREIERSHARVQALYDAAGILNPLLFRFPYGDHGGANKKRIEAFLASMDYTIYDWDLDTRDYQYHMKTPRITRSGILKRCSATKSGDVVLCHDYEPTGAWIIRDLQARHLLLPLADARERNLFESPEDADQDYELKWDPSMDAPEITPQDELLSNPGVTIEEQFDLEFDDATQKRLRSQ